MISLRSLTIKYFPRKTSHYNFLNLAFLLHLRSVETIEEYESSASIEEFRNKYREVNKYASMLREKNSWQCGMHAAEVVVAKDDYISQYVPIETRKDKASVLT